MSAEPPAGAADLIDHAVAAGLIPGAVLAAGLARPAGAGTGAGGAGLARPGGAGTGADGAGLARPGGAGTGVGGAEPLLLHVAGDAQCDEAGRRPMTADTIFDLASLTKVTATLPCLLYLIGRGDVGLDQPAQRYLPEFTGTGKDRVTVRQLLSHISGLPAERRYYQWLHDPAEVRSAALAEPLVAVPGTRLQYSDIGFIVLGEVAAAVAGCGLAELAQQVVFGPLAMGSTRYLPPPGWASRVAATEVVAGRAKVGVVHDENAEVLGGVAGHAGLFSTAADLARYAAAWAGKCDTRGVVLAEHAGRGAFWGMRSEALRCQTAGLGGRRGLGWGLREDRWDNMGDGWPYTGAGHTGFTGTSLSIDPASGLWAVLLTNAVHFGRGPEHSVVGLRKQVHAAVAGALLSGLR
jgi:CubicO group peptidase (beta-lactamase class C family)